MKDIYDYGYNGYPQDKIKKFEEIFLGKHKFAEWCRQDVYKNVDEVLPRYLITTMRTLHGNGWIQPISKSLKKLNDSSNYLFSYKSMNFGLSYDIESHEATLYQFDSNGKVHKTFELELLKDKIVIKR